MQRRSLLLATASTLLATGLPVGARALGVAGDFIARPPVARLDNTQSHIFREWMICIVHAQLQREPTPRWTQRDCAGLVRFAVNEALREHDVAWQRAMGLAGRRLPPPLPPGDAPRQLRHAWQRTDGSRAAWVGALELVQENTRFVSRDALQAQSGDLFFFDQGSAQHLMIWMGDYLAYHTGQNAGQDTPQPGSTVARTDNGLRACTLTQLMKWRDTRWQPQPDNPNFAGVFRLAFIA